MTIRTGKQIRDDCDYVIDDKFCDVEWYLGMDIDARVMFYTHHVFDNTSMYGDSMPEWLKKVYISQFKPYSLFIIDFCFGDLSEDFVGKLKNYVEKPLLEG